MVRAAGGGAVRDGGVRRRTVAECVDAPSHAGRIVGAVHVGAAARDGRVVEIGVFADGRARFRATACATLIAYAEVACEALEGGATPPGLDAAALQDRLTGVHPDHLERAALVAAALRAAFQKEEP